MGEFTRWLGIGMFAPSTIALAIGYTISSTQGWVIGVMFAAVLTFISFSISNTPSRLRRQREERKRDFTAPPPSSARSRFDAQKAMYYTFSSSLVLGSTVLTILVDIFAGAAGGVVPTLPAFTNILLIGALLGATLIVLDWV